MSKRKKQIAIAILAVLVFVGLFWRIFLLPPKYFPAGSVIKIDKGASLQEISAKLNDEGVVKSRWTLSFLIKILNKTRQIKYGDYLFEKPLSVFGVIGKIVRGEFGIGLVKVTIPEGSDVLDIADIFSGFENFDRKDFLAKASNMEGYLFPDTYLFLPSANADQVIKAMRGNFNSKVRDAKPGDIIMASLVEKEAPNDEKDRKIIAGILWKRIKIGMPLQVDAVFPYLTRREKVLLGDLRIDSPYNTYLHKGLPPTPIANPGLSAIDAALNPTESPYLYYLHDKSSKTHFAKTYEEHLINAEKYLR